MKSYIALLSFITNTDNVCLSLTIAGLVVLIQFKSRSACTVVGVLVVFTLVFTSTIIHLTWVLLFTEAVWSTGFIFKVATVILLVTQLLNGDTLLSIFMTIKLFLGIAGFKWRC